MTVRELADRMDADEVADWWALYALEEEERQRADLTQTVHQELTHARME